MKTLLSVLLLVACVTPAFAQSSDVYDRIRSLERQVGRLTSRVTELEYAVGGSQPNVPYEANCMVTDTFYSKTHLGTGTSKLDAEFNARKNCEKVAPAGNCSGPNVPLVCDDTTSNGGMKSVCVVTDTFYSKMHRGEGNSAVVAEAKARQACAQVAPAGNCAGPNVKARCDVQN
jgi:hypothetical protein